MTDNDRGADGPAALARASRMVPVAGSTRIGDERREVRRYINDCVIDALNARGFITDRQWRGGIMYRGRWLASRRAPAVVAGYGERLGGTAEGHTVGQLDARTAVTLAQACLPADLVPLVNSVCGEDENPGGRGRVVRLRDALDILADFFEVEPDYCRTPRWVVDNVG